MTAAMILFIYQVADRTFVYFDYNTTVSVDIRYLDEVPFPAVTLCNINTFRLEVLHLCQAHLFFCNSKDMSQAQFGIDGMKLINQLTRALPPTNEVARG